MALYSILRAGVRFFGFALPGSCVSTAINLSFSSGTCIPSTTWLDTRISFATSAHAWSWVMYGSFALILAVYPWRGKFNGWIAFMITGFTIAVHELIWFGTYFVVHPNAYDVWMNLQVYGSFIGFAIEGLVLWLILGHFREEWRLSRIFDLKVLGGGMAGVLIFYAGWASIGYPLTLDLKTGLAPPALFGVGWVDFIEFCSWLVMFMAVGAAYYASLHVRERV